MFEVHRTRENRLTSANFPHSIQMRNTDTLNCKLEQDLRLFKKFHDDQFEQQIKSHSVAIDQLQTEIRALKQTCHDKTDEVSSIRTADNRSPSPF